LSARSAESQNRTGDTAIFSRVLYQLSYLGLASILLGAGIDVKPRSLPAAGWIESSSQQPAASDQPSAISGQQ
jgi:hypothetical protein